MRFRSTWLVVLFGVVIVGLGVKYAHGIGWLPVVSSVASTIAVFMCRGLVLLGCTALWLINNIASRSIGGTILEVFIATINISTIVRFLLDRPRKAA